MYYNEKRKAITAKYVKTHLDDIKIRVPKGQREELKTIAAETGMSMNQMFITAVEEYIERNYKPEAENQTD
jgi:predicted HicB family RNase H-like nuclease